MMKFEYYNALTGEQFHVNSHDVDGDEIIFYVDYTSTDLQNWTANHTTGEILGAYKDGKLVLARSSVEATKFEGTPIEKQTRILHLNKITDDQIEFFDADFKDGVLEVLKLTHKFTGEITVNSIDI